MKRRCFPGEWLQEEIGRLNFLKIMAPFYKNNETIELPRIQPNSGQRIFPLPDRVYDHIQTFYL